MAYIEFEKVGAESALGLQLVSMTGQEEISELFKYELVIKSEDAEILTPTDLIGRDVSLRVDYFEDFAAGSKEDVRYIHGIVSRFTILNVDGFNSQADSSSVAATRYYAVELVPTLWFLTKKSRFHIYQDLTSARIINDILEEHDVIFRNPTVGITRENCVQYLETDYDFFTRLLEDEGYIYYFEHSKDGHELIITETSQYLDAGELSLGSEVSKWSPSFNFISGKWVCNDNSYEQELENKNANESSGINGLNNQEYSRFHTTNNIGCDADNSVLTTQAELLAGREDASYEVIALTSTSSNICAGTSFSLTGISAFSDISEPGLVVINVIHDMSASSLYSNEFSCIPRARRYWGKTLPVGPKVRGPMTAIVIENIDPLKLGRVKVAFFAEDQDNATTSGWIRVTQIFGGNVRGAIFIPEIDDEVLVTFLNGNPDRPLITGSIYNGTNKPLKGVDNEDFSSSRNGFITPAGELYFDDEDSNEMVHIRANKNYEKHVVVDDELTIGGKQNTSITGDEEKEILEGNKKTKVTRGEIELESTEKNIKMKTGINTEIDADDSIVGTAGKDVKMSAGSNFDLDAGSNYTLEAGSQIKLSVSGNTITIGPSGINMKVGQNSVDISMSGITVKGAMVSIEGSMTADLKAPMTTVSGDGMLTVKGGLVSIN